MKVNKDSLDIDKLKYLTETVLWVFKKDHPEKFDDLIDYIKNIDKFELIEGIDIDFENTDNKGLSYLPYMFGSYISLIDIKNKDDFESNLGIGLSMVNLDVFKKLTPRYSVEEDIKIAIDAIDIENCKIALANNYSCEPEEDIKNAIEDIESDIRCKPETKIVNDCITMVPPPENLHRLKY